MSDQEKYDIINDLKQILLGQTQPIKCGLQPDVVIEHTKILTTLQVDMSHVLAGVVEINKKIEEQNESHNNISNRILKIETEKNTHLGVISGVGSGIAIFIAALPYISKLLK